MDSPPKSTAANRRWSGWGRFSLRTLLIAVTLTAAVCGLLAQKILPLRHQQQALHALRQSGRAIHVRHRPLPDDWRQTLLRPFLGAQLFSEVYELGAQRTGLTDAELKLVGRLPYLENLYLADNPITDRGMQDLRGLRRLQVMSLQRTKVTDAGIDCLRECRSLNRLDIQGLAITSRSLETLGRLPKLDWVRVDFVVDGPMLRAMADGRCPPLSFRHEIQFQAVEAADVSRLAARCGDRDRRPIFVELPDDVVVSDNRLTPDELNRLHALNAEAAVASRATLTLRGDSQSKITPADLAQSPWRRVKWDHTLLSLDDYLDAYGPSAEEAEFADEDTIALATGGRVCMWIGPRSKSRGDWERVLFRLRDDSPNDLATIDLRKLPRLRRFTARDEMNAAVLSRLAVLQEIESFHVKLSADVTPEELRLLLDQPRLRRFSCRSPLSDQHVPAIAGAVRLRELSLGGANITAEGLAALSALPELEELDVWGWKESGDTQWVDQLPRLKRLALRGVDGRRDVISDELEKQWEARGIAVIYDPSKPSLYTPWFCEE